MSRVWPNLKADSVLNSQGGHLVHQEVSSDKSAASAAVVKVTREIDDGELKRRRSTRKQDEEKTTNIKQATQETGRTQQEDG